MQRIISTKLNKKRTEHSVLPELKGTERFMSAKHVGYNPSGEANFSIMGLTQIHDEMSSYAENSSRPTGLNPLPISALERPNPIGYCETSIPDNFVPITSRSVSGALCSDDSGAAIRLVNMANHQTLLSGGHGHGQSVGNILYEGNLDLNSGARGYDVPLDHARQQANLVSSLLYNGREHSIDLCVSNNSSESVTAEFVGGVGRVNSIANILCPLVPVASSTTSTLPLGVQVCKSEYQVHSTTTDSFVPLAEADVIDTTLLHEKPHMELDGDSIGHSGRHLAVFEGIAPGNMALVEELVCSSASKIDLGNDNDCSDSANFIVFDSECVDIISEARTKRKRSSEEYVVESFCGMYGSTFKTWDESKFHIEEYQKATGVRFTVQSSKSIESYGTTKDNPGMQHQIRDQVGMFGDKGCKARVDFKCHLGRKRQRTGCGMRSVKDFDCEARITFAVQQPAFGSLTDWIIAVTREQSNHTHEVSSKTAAIFNSRNLSEAMACPEILKKVFDGVKAHRVANELAAKFPTLDDQNERRSQYASTL